MGSNLHAASPGYIPSFARVKNGRRSRHDSCEYQPLVREGEKLGSELPVRQLMLAPLHAGVRGRNPEAEALSFRQSPARRGGNSAGTSSLGISGSSPRTRGVRKNRGYLLHVSSCQPPARRGDKNMVHALKKVNSVSPLHAGVISPKGYSMTDKGRQPPARRGDKIKKYVSRKK
jgi:hypothetical protein